MIKYAGRPFLPSHAIQKPNGSLSQQQEKSALESPLFNLLIDAGSVVVGIGILDVHAKQKRRRRPERERFAPRVPSAVGQPRKEKGPGFPFWAIVGWGLIVAGGVRGIFHLAELERKG